LLISRTEIAPEKWADRALVINLVINLAMFPCIGWLRQWSSYVSELEEITVVVFSLGSHLS